MNRYWQCAVLSALVCLSAGFWITDAQAQTCEPVNSVPTYGIGHPAPIVCDTHGAQHVVLRNADGTASAALQTGTASATPPTLIEGSAGSFSFDLAGNARVTLGTQLAGEDLTATAGGSATGVLVTEQRYLLSATVTSDTQIKGSAGFAKDVTCIGTDAAATAGSIVLYNKLTEAAPAIWTWNVAAAAVLTPITFPIDFVADTGLYLGFTTTADVACYVRYR